MAGINARRIVMAFSAALLTWAATGAFGEQSSHEVDAETLARIDRGFDEYRLDAHILGLAYGLVVDGRLTIYGRIVYVGDDDGGTENMGAAECKFLPII